MKCSIGDYVIVSSKMFRTGSTHICWVSLTLGKSQLGQIVGLVTRYDGDIKSGYSCDFEFDPSYFVPTKTHVFWEVKFGFLNKPIYVRDEDIQFASIDEVEELPKLYTRQCSYSEKDKKLLSEDSKDWPRDSKGRWISDRL